jgi:hypothetical protein
MGTKLDQGKSRGKNSQFGVLGSQLGLMMLSQKTEKIYRIHWGRDKKVYWKGKGKE